jgi:hypothetical protein
MEDLRSVWENFIISLFDYTHNTMKGNKRIMANEVFGIVAFIFITCSVWHLRYTCWDVDGMSVMDAVTQEVLQTDKDVQEVLRERPVRPVITEKDLEIVFVRRDLNDKGVLGKPQSWGHRDDNFNSKIYEWEEIRDWKVSTHPIISEIYS